MILLSVQFFYIFNCIIVID